MIDNLVREILMILSRTHGWKREDLVFHIVRNQTRLGLDDIDDIEAIVENELTYLIFEGYVNVNNGNIHTNMKHKKLGSIIKQ